eukprot:EG_transcript_38350
MSPPPALRPVSLALPHLHQSSLPELCLADDFFEFTELRRQMSEGPDMVATLLRQSPLQGRSPQSPPSSRSRMRLAVLVTGLPQPPVSTPQPLWSPKLATHPKSGPPIPDLKCPGLLYSVDPGEEPLTPGTHRPPADGPRAGKCVRFQLPDAEARGR